MFGALENSIEDNVEVQIGNGLAPGMVTTWDATGSIGCNLKLEIYVTGLGWPPSEFIEKYCPPLETKVSQ